MNKIFKCVYFLLIIFITICFTDFSYAGSQIIGTYEKDNTQVIFNNGLSSCDISTYKISVGNKKLDDVFIIIEDLKGLDYDMKWNSKSRVTTFTKHKYEDDYFNEKFSCNQKVLNDINNKLNKKGNIYKSDIKVYIDNKEASVYNANGYSLISLNELKRLEVSGFFKYEPLRDMKEKVYPMVINKIKWALVTLDCRITSKLMFDEIICSKDPSKNMIGKIGNEYFVIDKNGEKKKKVNCKEIKKPLNWYNTDNYIVIDEYGEYGHYGVIFDFEGNTLFDGDCDRIHLSKNNYLSIHKGKKTIIYKINENKLEKIMEADESKNIGDIGENKFGVYKRETKEYTIVDNKGNDILNKKYKNVYNYNNGYAPVELNNGRFSFVDKNLNLITNSDFTDVSSFHNNIAVFRNTEYSFGVINNNGDIILNPEYERLTIYEGTFIEYKKNNKYGVINNKEETLIPCEYESVYKEEDRFFALKNNKVNTFDLSGNIISSNLDSKNFEFGNESYYKVNFIDEDTYYNNGKVRIIGSDSITYHDIRSSKNIAYMKYYKTSENLLIPYDIEFEGLHAPDGDDRLEKNSMIYI